MALQPYGEEDLNYFKLSSLVLNEFPRALRNLPCEKFVRLGRR